MSETRSARRVGVQFDWVGDTGTQGVGGRQAGPDLPRRGGGYLYECNGAEFSGLGLDGAKFRELADMGLPQVWLAVAREIGYDAFLAMWRVLDEAVELRSDSDSMIEVQLRRLSSFRRYQRNRFIETLAGLGFRPDQIQKKLVQELGERLHHNTVRRLAKKRYPRNV